MKKTIISMMMVVVVGTLLAGCGGKEPQVESGSIQDTQVTVESQEIEQSGKIEAGALLDQFLEGEIDAWYGEDTFNISDLQMDVEDWASYSVGERLDLDNDADNEQILNGPYGGIYLDASDGKVKVLACGEGTARNLSYIYFDGEVWIVYYDDMHVGRACYFLEKYYGADDLAETMSLERYEEEDCVTYYLNGQEVSSSIYGNEYEKFFGTYEVYDPVMDTEIVDEGSSVEELYKAFLKNEISVANPYVEGGVLSVMDDEDFEFTNAKKEYTLLDVNSDGAEELIFRMKEDYSNIMYILGVSGEELVAFDVYITHSKSMAHGVYDNGIVWWGQNYDGEEEVFYTYTSEGEAQELVHFVKANEMADEENTFDYFYYDGNVEEKNYLHSYEEYVSFSSAYKGNEPEWQELDK